MRRSRFERGAWVIWLSQAAPGALALLIAFGTALAVALCAPHGAP